MLSKQRWRNAGSRTLLYESTCQKHISLPPRFWKGIIPAIQFSALLQQKTLVLRHLGYNPMLSMERWRNAGSRTLLYESTCLKHISQQPWFWRVIIAAIQLLALLQLKTLVLRHFVYNPMLKSKLLMHISLQPSFWKGGIAAFQLLAQTQQKTLVLRHFVYNAMLSKLRWWNPGSRTLL
ncbi:hypothetical protein ANTQUA_LOCUS6921 [Anthophora quadrimaculata]